MTPTKTTRELLGLLHRLSVQSSLHEARTPVPNQAKNDNQFGLAKELLKEEKEVYLDFALITK